MQYHYDTEQRLKSMHNERGEFYGLFRDACGRIICEQGFDGRQFHYERNQGGQVVRCKTPRRTIEYSYTPLGLLSLQHTTRRGYEISSSFYSWDLAGRLRSLMQGHHFREFLYDYKGNLTDAYYDHQDHIQRVADRIGNLYPDESYPFRKVEYDKGGRIREDQDWTYHLNEEGFLLKRVSKSVVVERYDYIKRKRFAEPQTWTYEWDGAGQLTAVSNNEQKDMGGKPVRLRFEYDALGRRTAKISVWGRSAYHRVTRFLWDGMPEEGEVVLRKSGKY